nr:serine/arginine repetitive matrix protein 1-like [Procambarus clarkii]
MHHHPPTRLSSRRKPAEVEEHVRGQGDLRALTEAREGGGWELARPQKRLVHQSARKWGTVDTQDLHETTRVQDGHVVTETERTTQHEDYENESLPDSGSSLSDGSVHEEARETHHNIVHTKDEDLVEYYGVPRGGTLAQGVKLGEGMHVVSEDFHEDREGEDLDSLSERLRRARRLGTLKPKPRDTPERTDALTRRPLDYHQEEETRKSETNRWLENHFGSESGRSGSSQHEPEEEGGVQTVGGNVITITMSPRPATPEDQPDAPPPPIHRRAGSSLAHTHSQASKAPPPPPPPKPAAAWTPPPPPASSHQQSSPHSEEITDTMIAAARARLRSTGRILDDSDQGTPPISPAATNGTRFTSFQDRMHILPTSAGTFSSPPVSPTERCQPVDSPVYGSRFKTGSPSGIMPTRLFSTPNRGSRPAAQSPPDSPPPPLPASPPPPPSNNVNRSQSFNVNSKNWMNSNSKISSSRLMDSRLKEYRSEEQLDTVGHRPARRWPPSQRDVSPETPRESTPPPPPRQRISHSANTNYTHYNTAPTRSSKLSKTSTFASQTIARDSGTQTDPSPVPPPRTKKKNKPKTYYFGQDSSSSTSSSNRVLRTTTSAPTTNVSYTSTPSKHNQSSPKVERKFRTSKTITPVIVSNTNSTKPHSILKNRSWHYRSMDELSTGVESSPNASWTNTVDPRRRPRDYSQQTKEPETRTLPKKLMNGTLSPSKTYIFGGDTTSSVGRVRPESSSRLRRTHGGSMVNVSLASMSSPKSKVHLEPEDRQLLPENRHSPREDRQSPPKDRHPPSKDRRSPPRDRHSPPRDKHSPPRDKHSPPRDRHSPPRDRHSPPRDRHSPSMDSQSPSRSIRPVIRSQSLNVKPAPLSIVSSPVGVSTSNGLSSHQRTSTVYKSSPYLNLRSPNLIATIARSNSTRRTPEDQNGDYDREESPPPGERHSSPRHTTVSSSRNTAAYNNHNPLTVNGQDNREDEKRNRFMKGLLTSAPELFHFIHGDEVDKQDNDNGPNTTRQSFNPPESPPQLIRPPESPLTSPPATSPPASAPRIFTFGRGEAGSQKRNPSLSQESNNRFSSLGRPRESLTSNYRDNNSSSRRDTASNQRNSLSSQYHRNAVLNNNNGTSSLNRPKFNLKSSGGSSLLYSTSFRNRQDQGPASLTRRGSDSNDPPTQSQRWREQDDNVVTEKDRGKVASNITRDGAVLIPIRDWNSR